MVHQREAVKEQKNMLKQGEESSLDFVRSDTRGTRITPIANDRVQEKLSVLDVEEGPTPNKAVRLKRPAT